MDERIPGVEDIGAAADGLQKAVPEDSTAAEHKEEHLAERGGIVTARGTGDGLMLRLDGRVERAGLKSALEEFMKSRAAFLSGQEVTVEWVGGKPDDEFQAEIGQILKNQFSIAVKNAPGADPHKMEQTKERSGFGAVKPSIAGDDFGGRLSESANPFDLRRRSSLSRSTLGRFVQSEDLPPLEGATRLFDGVRDITKGEAPSISDRSMAGGSDSLLWDTPDCRIIQATLRSGQKLETEHSLVVLGDVNSGAEIVAGGDILVLGTLRGVAHAGAYDETGGGRIIFALNLQPTQLRIGMVISRGGAGENRERPEIARVDGNMIVVEPYHSKGLSWRRGR